MQDVIFHVGDDPPHTVTSNPLFEDINAEVASYLSRQRVSTQESTKFVLRDSLRSKVQRSTTITTLGVVRESVNVCLDRTDELRAPLMKRVSATSI